MLANVFLGLSQGVTYGLLAVGLVLVYRINRVINFAHGAIGVLAAAVLGRLVIGEHVPYWLAFVAALAVAALAGAIAEAAVIRRLRDAPKVMSLVATLGLAAFFTGLAPQIFSGLTATLSYPEPPGFPTFRVGVLPVRSADTAGLILSPLLVAGLAAFLRYSRFGLALRASASNPDTARTVGIYAKRMSQLAWVIASCFAAFTAVLVFPRIGLSGSGSAFGPALLLRALAAAVIARMSSLPVALGAGVAIGVAESVIFYEFPTPGVRTLLIFGLLFAGLLFQRRGETRTRERDSWSGVAAPLLPAVADAVRARLGRFTAAGLGGLVVLVGLLPLVMSNSTSIGAAAVLGLAVVALSVGLVTGQGGHLSLGQFAFAGIGAAVGFHVEHATHNAILGIIASVAAGAVSAVVIGLPALRIRGILYAVATLSFAFMAEDYLLRKDSLLGVNAQFTRPVILGHSFDRGKDYFLLSYALLLLALLLVARMRASGLTRSFIALRDNEDQARSFTIPAVRRTLQLFGLGGALAGLGGTIWAHAIVFVGADNISDTLSINVVASAVLGGLTYGFGPLLGALYIFALPQFVKLDGAAVAATSLGWLLLVLYLPSGLGSLGTRARDAIAVRLAGRLTEPESGGLSTHQVRLTVTDRAATRGETAAPRLVASELVKSFGGVRAVRGVSLAVERGEILGLIGPNGAGKTTFFELLSGFTRPDAGQVRFGDRDVTRASPEERARLGIVRSFQDSRLFATLTVLEALQLAQERTLPTSLGSGLIAGAARDRERRQRADELVELMGLRTYAAKRVGELSTGTRRITELACMVSLRPSVLLLDEPSSGIAQRESEALGDLLRQIRDHLDATLIVIEHDVPLVMNLCDRVAAMESGELIALGAPAEVAADPRVIESYLGGDVRAIQRSRGTSKAVAPPQRTRVRKPRVATIGEA